MIYKCPECEFITVWKNSKSCTCPCGDTKGETVKMIPVNVKKIRVNGHKFDHEINK